jgi:hypothetical protein
MSIGHEKSPDHGVLTEGKWTIIGLIILLTCIGITVFRPILPFLF